MIARLPGRTNPNVPELCILRRGRPVQGTWWRRHERRGIDKSRQSRSIPAPIPVSEQMRTHGYMAVHTTCSKPPNACTSHMATSKHIYPVHSLHFFRLIGKKVEVSLTFWHVWEKQGFYSRAMRHYTPLCPSVGRSVGPHFPFFMFLRSLASLLLAECFSNSNTAPAHPHATEVAVYPALFS